jgi:hypothetical protein
MKRWPAVAALFAALATGRVSQAEDPPRPAIFAVIVGSNASVDTELAPLKYADDDAARYLDLFRLLGARTYLLTRLDANTARLHPQAAAEAEMPRAANLERVLAQAASEVAEAHARGVETTLYFLYAGHGSVRNGEGYLTLEDARLTGADLANKVVARIPADRVHFVIDACDSYLIAYPRGPGGVRRPVTTFQATSGLGDNPKVGLLLSSSQSRESHEWDGFQAGVFSHEVRSGLYGAADADGDGQVTYREIAAFVQRANAAIPNERFRPDVYAHPPRGVASLLDIRHRMERRVEIDGQHPGHYVVEDARGVRVADLHNMSGASVRILRPAANGKEYLMRLDDEKEFVLAADQGVVLLAELEPTEPRVAARGAAHDAFDLLFSLPFGEATVEASGDPAVGWSVSPQAATAERPLMPATRESGARRIVAWSLLGAGAVGLGVGATFSVASVITATGTSPSESQQDAARRNDRIGTDRTAAAIGFVSGGALAATGLVLLLWPDAPKGLVATASSKGGFLGYAQAF